MTSLTAAAQTNDSSVTLEALRNTLWETIYETNNGRDMAALSKRWLDVSKQLGSYDRDSLEELRDLLARAIDNSNAGKDIAAMSIRLMEVLQILEALPDSAVRKNPVLMAREMVRKNGAP